MDRYHHRIGVASSLKNYWRVLRTLMLDRIGRTLNESEESEERDVHNI